MDGEDFFNGGEEQINSVTLSPPKCFAIHSCEYSPVLFSCLNLAEMRLHSLDQTIAAFNFTAHHEVYGSAHRWLVRCLKKKVNVVLLPEMIIINIVITVVTPCILINRRSRRPNFSPQTDAAWVHWSGGQMSLLNVLVFFFQLHPCYFFLLDLQIAVWIKIHQKYC